jgi:hypothetical protein
MGIEGMTLTKNVLSFAHQDDFVRDEIKQLFARTLSTTAHFSIDFLKNYVYGAM